jgi:hypothetical protein
MQDVRSKLLAAVVLLGAAAIAYATDGYSNTFVSLPPELTTWHQLGDPPATVGPPYLATIGGASAVAADVSYGAGYTSFDFGQFATNAGGLALAGAPVDITNGILRFRHQFDTTANPPGTDPMYAWFRLYAGTWDGSKWVFVNRVSYPFEAQVNGGWAEGMVNVMEPLEYYNANPFDWTHIYRIRIDYVWWNALLYSPATLAMDYIQIEKGAAPVANAGPDQQVNAQDCGPVAVTMNGSNSVAGAGSRANAVIASWEWSEGAQVLSNMGPIATDITLGPGVHTIKLKITCDDGVWDTDTASVTITAANLHPLPVSIPMTAQINYGGGDPLWDVIYLANYDTIWNMVIGSPDGTHIDLYGADWYWGPYVAIDRACYQTPIDLTTANLKLKFTARYFQDPETNSDPYTDAPIFVQTVDTAGKRVCWGIRWATQAPWNYPHYPDWTTAEMDFNPAGIDADSFWTDAGYDLTKMREVRFFGTDWAGGGFDYVEIKDLWIGLVSSYPLGDLNCDGLVNPFDIDPFVECLVSGTPTPPCSDCANADINKDGLVNPFDIDPFVECIINNGCL